MNIYEKMAEITAEINTVAKNLQVDTGKGNSYKAVSEADVLAAVKPIEKKYGVYSYPYSRQIVESGELISQTKYGERKNLFLRVQTTYRFINTEKPEEHIDIVTYGDGVDTQDKAPGKAMTYGDKYALLKAYKIQTGDDPDQQASGELIAQTIRAQKIDQIKVTAITARANSMGLPIEAITNQYGIKALDEMTEEQFADCVKRLEAEAKKRAKK